MSKLQMVLACCICAALPEFCQSQTISQQPTPNEVAKTKNISVKSVEKLRQLGVDLWRMERLPSRTLIRALQKAQYEDLAKRRADYDRRVIAGANFTNVGTKLSQAVNALEKRFSTLAPFSTKGGVPISGIQIRDRSTQASSKGQAQWVSLGPLNVGGRTRCLVVDRRNSNTFWVGSAGGGIWKSDDAGQSFNPVDDHMGRLTVSCIAQNPSQPNVLVAGTGEGFGNIDAMRGGGLFQTRDGTSWNLIPGTDRDEFAYVTGLAFDAVGGVMLVAAHGSGSGIYRSVTETREDLVRVNESDASGIQTHPSDLRFAIAGSRYSGRSFYSADGGQSWSESTHPAWSGRVEVAYAKANPNIVYASVDMSATGASNDPKGLIFKSTDGGRSFSSCGTLRPDGRPGGYLGGQGWYGNCIWAGDPTDPNLILVGGIDLWRSTNGGESIRDISTWYEPQSVHADHHIIVSDPSYDGFSNTTVYFGNDGGLAVAANAKTVGADTSLPRVSGWRRLNNGYVSTMFYDIAATSSGFIVGGTQDNGTLTTYNPSGNSNWFTVYGGDGGYCEVDEQNRVVYGEYVYGNVHRVALGTETYSTSISGNFWNGQQGQWQWKQEPWRIEDSLQQRGNFIAPIALDHSNPDVLYVGMSSLWRTNNARAAIDPGNFNSGPVWSRVKSPSNTSISAIAVDRRNSNVVWAGHNNGTIYRTADANATSPTWTSVSPQSGFPRRFCTRIIIDPSDSNTVYATFGEFAQDNVWRSADAGQTWESVSSNLIAAPVRALAIHPQNSNLLYAGTEVGLFVSDDRGATWSPTNQGPTRCSVTDLVWANNRLIASTYGRGVFSIDLSTTH